MADQFKEFRRHPPLIEHTGILSTIDVESVRSKVTRKYEAYKKTNPPAATLITNMTQWENFSLEAAYYPGYGHYFWARQIHAGDVIDITFQKKLSIKAVYVVTGFDKEEERAGHDRLVEGRLQVASDNDKCQEWRTVNSKVDALGKMVSNSTDLWTHTRCLRLQVLKATSDWLVIRLIRVMLLFQ